MKLPKWMFSKWYNRIEKILFWLLILFVLLILLIWTGEAFFGFYF